MAAQTWTDPPGCAIRRVGVSIAPSVCPFEFLEVDDAALDLADHLGAALDVGADEVPEDGLHLGVLEALRVLEEDFLLGQFVDVERPPHAIDDVLAGGTFLAVLNEHREAGEWKEVKGLVGAL